MTFKRKPKQAGRYSNKAIARSTGWPAPLPNATHIGTARIRESHSITVRGDMDGAAMARVAKVLAAHAPGPLVAAECSRSKYGNRKCEADGITFDSERERSRYYDLKRWETAGIISGLRHQVQFEIAPAVKLDGRKRPARHYVADFVYRDKSGREVVEDVKGYRTPEYRLKRHLVMARHGIEVQEV